jgi:hypothetical protein
VLDLLVAVSLICCWLFAPAITVMIGGNIALIGFQITPETLWALGVTELVFALPIVFGGWTATHTRAVTGVLSLFLILLLALATIGTWLGWSRIYIIGGICVLYLSAVMWQQVSASTRIGTTTHR